MYALHSVAGYPSLEGYQMSQPIANDTRVKVHPQSPSGKPWARYLGTVKGRRDNVLGLGSVEYLIEKDDVAHAKWVPESQIEVIK